MGSDNKQSVVFVHGAVADYRIWQGQIEPFSHHYRVIAYSRRHNYPNEFQEGFQYTADNDGITQFASDLAELIRNLNLAPAHLVGHSDGGFTTLLSACKNPELVGSLVLGEPPAIPLVFKSNDKKDVQLAQALVDNVLKPAGEAMAKGDFEKGVRIFIDGVMSKGFFDQLPPPVRTSMVSNAPGFLKQLPNPMPSGLSVNDLDRASLVPTLFVRGELSPEFFQRATEIIKSRMKRSEEVFIEGATHELGIMTQPQTFNSKVLEFLQKN
ncbi:alpha/beta fold hydrolase [Candidatus Nitrososphaera evergladensis]|uniref:alpha/beta fold hydrolase n=1 Tax=Candidatus Nitrososphaera evergladensis TaxID=1459637 RepID=UPI00130EFE63|nr:alpha/beta hydrolase [Candidatus Nitrososphaera evergladensis]